MKIQKLWTKETEQDFRELMTQNLTFEEIGNKIGRTVKSCKMKATKLGLVNSYRGPRASWLPEEESKLRELISQKIHISEIVKIVGRTKKACINRIKELGLSLGRGSGRKQMENYQYWTQTEDTIIEELVLKGTPIKEIAEKMKRTYSSCASRSSFLGLYNIYSGPLIYSVDKKFWDEPNPINCYYSGILSADGSIEMNNARFEYVGTLNWELEHSDIQLLEDFKKYTKYTGPIYTHERKGGFIHSKISISCREWNKQLIERYNIIPRKTYRTMPPNDISDQLMFCWLTGLIDGDGTIGLRKDRDFFAIRIYSCSEGVINFIYEFLKEKFPQKFRNKPIAIPRKIKNTNCWEISIQGIRAVCFFSYLRQYNLPKLERKWARPELLDYEEKMKAKYPHFFDFSYLPEPVK